MATGRHSHDFLLEEPWRQRKRIHRHQKPKTRRQTNWYLGNEAKELIFKNLLNFHIIAPQTCPWEKSSLRSALGLPRRLGSALTGDPGARQPFFSIPLVLCYEQGNMASRISRIHGHLSSSGESNPRRHLGKRVSPVHSGICSWPGCASHGRSGNGFNWNLERFPNKRTKIHNMKICGLSKSKLWIRRIPNAPLNSLWWFLGNSVLILAASHACFHL